MCETIPVQVDDEGRRFVEIEELCPACTGSGVYRGYQEPEGVANVCQVCKGRGGRIVRIYFFSGDLRERKGIEYVRDNVDDRSRVTYKQFLAGWRP